MGNWLEIQNRILNEEDLIAEFDIETITPTRIGGYNAAPYSLRLNLSSDINAKSLKGVWRWWARTAIVGVFNGKIDYEKANTYLSKIFGGAKKDKRSSSFRLIVSNIELSRISRGLAEYKYNEYRRVPRIKLLLMGRRGESVEEERRGVINEGSRFKVSIYGERDNYKVNFALSSFLLSSIFGGIGSITKRAFGSVRISSFKPGNINIDGEINSIINSLENKSFSAEELEKTLKELCSKTIEYARTFISKEMKEKFIETSKYSKKENEIPIVPSLSNIKINVIECRDFNLIDIGEVVLKQSWKKRLKMSIQEEGGELHTWILGLPRRHLLRGQRGFGYAIKERNGKYNFNVRRLSSIGIRCFKAKNNRNFIILFGLLSKDWPIENLYHLGERPVRSINIRPVKNINIRQCPGVNGSSLEKVFDVAFSEVSNLIRERLGVRQ
ncbi:MAG: type III-B CRISPR module RAMP protein Cmr1 [Candidatus Methanomethylicia archaeon]